MPRADQYELPLALLLAVVGVLFVPAPFKTAAVGLVGVPVIAWMTRRDHRKPSPPGGVHCEDTDLVVGIGTVFTLVSAAEIATSRPATSSATMLTRATTWPSSRC
ncbi:hypothetical protein [Actinacidiphila bryophytorum]|uniref:hypothetical protein n=1 Tax=Actinacidiphila bryophytorum TaxID=1436133 RepID=UPI00196184E0|nr:hypothetical protein [Actinacidiphila bryophytorum]MBM9435326.1 hypothetical protein [Actinacidiphila bryophytorum]